MINFEDILSQLNNGVEAEDIAKEFTSALNTAISEKKKADEAAIVAKKAAEREGKKFQDFKEVINDFIVVIADYYPELVDLDDCDDETLNEVTKTVITSIKSVEKINDLLNSFATIDIKDNKSINTKDVNVNAIMHDNRLEDINLDNVINKFLKKMSW